ncbi:MAG: hypothetical protein KC656_07065 [Myxococcales bacterium]|nr:hypothetical protein [Myxococcales bacterium]
MLPFFALAHAAPVDLLEGTWALEMHAVSAARVAVFGDVRSVTRTAVLVRVERDGDGWVHDHRTCGSSIEGGPLVRTRIPAAYFDAVRPKRLAPSVEVDADTGTPRYRVDLERFAGGWDPSACERVPSEADDPCVRDWDGDGKPGITIEVKAPLLPWAEVYVAQQTHPRLDGHLVSPDLIAGRLRVGELDNRVLGASSPLFHATPDVRSVDAASTFRMERVEDGASCADVLELTGIADAP